jgi:hypothetical protein
MKGEVEKARGEQASDQQYVNIAVQSFTQSRDTHAVWFRNAERWYKLYRQYKQGRFIPYRNNITVPLAFSMIQSGIARKMEISAGGPPIAYCAGGPEDQMVARKREFLINQQLHDSQFVDKESMTLAAGEIYGIAVSKVYWDFQQEQIKFRADLGAGEQEFAGEDVTFDGPNYKPVNVRNFFPQPGIARLHEMSWVVHRFHLDVEDINRLAENGFYLKRGAQATQANPTVRKDKGDEMLANSENPATGMPDDGILHTDYEKPVEIIEYWGRVPRSMHQKGEVNLVITVAARQHLLRAVANPYGYIPFIVDGPMPDPDNFHKPSKLEVIEKIQVSSNALASQKMDAINLTVDPQYIYNKRTTSRPSRLWNRPGAVHGWEGPVDDGNFRALVPDMRGLMNAYQELEQQAQWMEQGTGVIRDAIQGFGGPDRETARGFVGRQNAANARLLMEARLHEALYLEPLADAYVRLNREFLEFPQVLRIMGTASILDPLTLQPLPPDAGFFGVNDLLPDYDAQATGVLRTAGKGEMLQNLILLMQAAQTNPVGIQLINWVAFFRQLFTLADVPNVDEMLSTDPLIQQVAAQAQAGMAEIEQAQADQAASVPVQENQIPQLGAIS